MIATEELDVDELHRAFRGATKPFLFRMYDATEENYEEIDNEDCKCEFLDGVLIVHSPATFDHENVTGFLFMLLRDHASRHRLGEVVGSNAVMQLGQRRFSPDISFLAAAHESRIRGGRVIGPMDLVVEVLSPSTRDYDRGEKLRAYREGLVPEIWLIDPDAKTFESHRLTGTAYTSTVLQNGKYASPTVAGLTVLVDWLWQRPLPSLMDCRLT